MRKPRFSPEKLWQKRRRLKRSRREVQDKSGVPVPTLYAWEKGKRRPSAEALARLAHVYKCTLDEFFD